MTARTCATPFDPTGTVSLLAAILRGTPRFDGALCRGRPELFDPPDPAADPDDEEYRLNAAVSLCRRCPALTECRAWFDALRPSQRPLGVVAGQVVTPATARKQRTA